MSNPLAQFAIKPLYSFKIAALDASFSNSSLLMVLTLLAILLFYSLAAKSHSAIPSRLQAIGEMSYQFIANMIKDTAGPEGLKYFPIIFSLFTFILTSNLLGMLPYSFTSTSHFIVTFGLAAMIFIIINIIALCRHGLHFFSFFLPSGTPIWLAPLMIVIELFTYLSRPISLSLRLAANMIAGHALLKVLAGFVVTLGIFGWLPIPVIMLMTGFEIFVAVLQAYIFTILTCVYLNDAINLH